MKKQKKEKRQKKSDSKPFPFIPEKYEHTILIALLFLSFLIFFHEALLENKVFLASDILSPATRSTYEQEVQDRGEFPHWNPFIFSGMPGFASFSGGGGHRWYDITTTIYNYIQNTVRLILRDNDVFRIVFRHFLLAVALYALIYYKVRNKWAAFFGALSFSFGLAVVKWITAGHAIKSMSFAIFPILLLFAEQFREKIKVWHIVVLTLLLGLGLSFYHIQMYFYAYFGLVIYFAYNFIREIKNKESLLKLLRSGVIIAFCTGFAFLMSSDRYFSMLEYNTYSIRGAAPITEQDRYIEERGGGLDYDYATSWSFSIEEITTFLVPSFYGFGNNYYQGPLTNFQEVKVNTYFGQMPFTEGPMYMGVIIIALAAIGIAYYWRDPFVRYLIIMSVIALFISFGRNFPLLYDLMYHYVPFFNSFRVPSMILILVHTGLIILSAYGLAAVIGMAKSGRKPVTPNWLKRTLIVFGTLFILSFIARNVFESSYIAFIEGSGTQLPHQIFPWMYEQMMNDLSFTLGFFLLTFGIIALYLNRSVTITVFISALILISVVDLWRIAYRGMELHPATILEQQLRATDGVEFVKQDDELFRILELQDGRPLTDNRPQYFLLQNAYGYHAAKLRIYQDLLDVVGITRPAALRLLNVKYIISNRFYDEDFLIPVFDGEKKVMEVADRMPRAWFVDSVETRAPLDILHGIRDAEFDPATTAFVEEPLDISFDRTDETTSLTITEWDYHRITAETQTGGTHMLVFSEIYYPPGWHAYLNGEKTDIIKTNYLMRGIIIPPGEHTIVMEYHSNVYSTGKTITLLTNIILLGAVAGVVGIAFVRKRGEMKREK